jgi:biopolymer transport protein ExbD
MARRQEGFEKINVPMAPMIDVVFQLLIFFMLTLKIVAPEGDFDINMPLGAGAPSDELPPLDLKVRLLANPDGTLQQMTFNSVALGNDYPACFDRLNQEIARIVGGGKGYSDELEVEVDADYGLHYMYTMKAVSSCSGRFNARTGGRVTYIEKIKLAKPRPPGGP